MNIADLPKLSMISGTYTDLAERCDNYPAYVRPRESEHEDRCHAVEHPTQPGSRGWQGGMYQSPSRYPEQSSRPDIRSVVLPQIVSLSRGTMMRLAN
jgi:hypothetical protein